MYNSINILGLGYSLIADRSNTIPNRAFWRIYWNPKVGGYVKDGKNKYYLDRSKIIAIPPGVSVDQGMYQDFESLHIHVDGGRILASYNEILTMPVSGQLLDKLEYLVRSIDDGKKGRSAKSLNPYLEICLHFIIYAVFAELNRDHLELMHPDDERINTCIERMQSSLGEGIENAELARIAGMSKNSFIRFFKGETGLPPQQFFLNLRLEESAILLACTEKTIEEISEECGFCERSYYSRLFKREYGVGPATYRKQCTWH